MDDLLARLATYPGVFALCATSGILYPLSEDVPLLYAGVLVNQGLLAWLPVILVAATGVLLRDSLFFTGGYLVGRAVLDSDVARRLIGGERIEKAQGLVERRGGMSVLIGRFSIGFRTSVFVVAGSMGVRPAQFLLWDVIGLAVAVPLAVVIGYFIGEPAVAAALWLLDHRWIALGVLGVLVTAFTLWRLKPWQE